MRFVIQRVNRGCVKVSSKTVGQIGKGLMILVGLSDRDTDEHIEHVVDKFLNIRLFDDEKGNRWKESVKSLGLEILLVSQFTLYHVLKGNKPDFHEAMGGEQARVLFDKIVKRAREKYDEKKIQTGAFGEYMQIDMECDGPVTINWEYPQKSKHNNEDNVKMLFEKNNILLSAKQNKANPPTAFYSSNILGNMPVLVQEFLNNGIINIKIITNNPSIAPLMKEVIDYILN